MRTLCLPVGDTECRGDLWGVDGSGRVTTENTKVKLGLGSYLGYAAGDMANNLVFTFQAVFLVIYYTNVANLAAVDVGILLLVVRIWSGVCDLIAGRLIDTRTSPRGRFRPYLIWAALPLLVASLAMFSVPAFDSYRARLGYAWATSAILMFFYSLVSIPYASLASAITSDPVERVGLNSYRMGGVMLFQLVLVGLISPQISLLGRDPDALQRFFTIVASVFVLIGLILYVVCYRMSVERVPVDPKSVTLRETWAAVRANRPLLILCASSAVLLAGQFGVVGLQAHYTTLVLGNSGSLFLLMLAQTGTSLVMVPLAPKLVKRWDLRRVYLGFAVVSAVGLLGLSLAPANLGFVIGCFAVQGLGGGALNALMYALAAECVDHGRRVTGIATPGAVYSTYQVSRKLAQALAGALAGWGLALGGITAATQPGDPGAVTALVWVMSIVPGLLILLGGLVILAFPRLERVG